jgi:hypothetical protein
MSMTMTAVLDMAGLLPGKIAGEAPLGARVRIDACAGTGDRSG